MNSTKKPTSKAKRTLANAASKKEKKITRKSWEETFDARRLLAIPLTGLVLYCAYLITQNLGGFAAIYRLPLEAFIFLPMPMLLVAAFCCLAAYMLVTGKPIGKLATCVAWIFIVLIGWLALASLASAFPGSNPGKCAGLFGAQQNCADVGYFQAYVLLLNPFTLGLYSLLSVAGVITMIMRLKK